MTLEQIVKQSQGEQYVYPDVFTDKCVLILYFLMINFMP